MLAGAFVEESSMSSHTRVLAVVGATGNQGGSLAHAALADAEKRFKVRALTRNPQSANAKELAALGADVVQADLDDLDSLKQAFAGAQAAYCVTNFWEHFSPQKELEQATNLAEAAQHAGVAHVVWSTLEDTRLRVPLDDDRMPTLMGEYKVPHFDAKGEADAEFAKRDVPTTYMLTSYYWENLLQPTMGLVRGDDSGLLLVLPMADKLLPGIATSDIGRCAYGIFCAGSNFIGKTVGIAGEHLGGNDMAAALSEALGEAVQYYAIEPSAFRALGFPGADDIGNMFQYKADFNREFVAARDVDLARRLNPGLLTFRDWLAQNASNISRGAG
jgi:uncharacterized protein YbjT (DUF2867 family)